MHDERGRPGGRGETIVSATRTLGTSAVGLAGAIAVLACSDDRPASLDPAGIATAFDGDSSASSTASNNEATTDTSDGAASPAASEASDDGRPGPASSSGVVEDTWASAEEGVDAHADTSASVTAEDGTGKTHGWDDPGPTATDATTALGGDDETGADPPPTPEPAQ